MARAQSLDELLDFESRWDEALRAVLLPLGLPVHTAFDAEKLEPPYIEAIFTFLGEYAAGGGSMPQARGGAQPTTFNQVSYRGRVQIQLHVHRGGHTPAQVSAWRGGVRRIFMPAPPHALNPITLPYYEVVSVTIPEGDRLTDEGRDLDIVQFRYEFVFGILADSWPV